MGKFKLVVKLQGLEIQIEGSKEDVPNIANNLGAQVAGLLQPMTTVVDATQPSPSRHSDQEGVQPKPRRKRSKGSHSLVSDAQFKELPTWKHDPLKWGSPTQEWSTADKALWLLYVVAQETPTKEMSAGMVAETFNTHFRQSKKIRATNVSRDFGKMKQGNRAEVSDTHKDGIAYWFTTELGDVRVKELIAKVQAEQKR